MAAPPLISVPEEDLRDLHARLRGTRWPQPWPTAPWEAGTDIRELRRLVDHWLDGFDWRAAEAEINALPSHSLDIDGQHVHYLRFDASDPSAPWLLLTNGWPSTYPPHEYVTVLTALALFPADLQHPPREWAERTHNLQRYTVFERGGHFAALEATQDLADDIRTFFGRS
jgi:hypothetical protein